MEFAQQLGRRMRRARIAHGMTQSDLAASAGVGANYIPRLERGEMVPSLEAAWKIARALGVSLDQLCGVGKKKEGEVDALERLQRDDVEAMRRVVEILDGVVPKGRRRR